MRNERAALAVIVGFLLSCGETRNPTTTNPEPPTPRPSTEARPLEELLANFPFTHSSGPVRVQSDISGDFSRQHGEHLALVYAHFARLFTRSYGGAAVAYYTRDEALYRRVFAFCPGVIIPGGRSVTGCYDARTGIQSLIIIPSSIPDFATQLHEVSHQFLYATWPPAEDRVWFKEGTGMFWESGAFDGAGQLVVRTPIASLRTGIRRAPLIPLGQLLEMDRDAFYGHPDPQKLYSQSGMLLFYLMQRHPGVLSGVFDDLNSGAIRNNGQLVSAILGGAGLTVVELEQAYVAYALTL